MRMLLVGLVFLGSACRSEGTQTPDTWPPGVLAMVNGRSITDEDVRHWLMVNSRGRIKRGTPKQVKNTLEAIIQAELAAQQATRLGLDKDAELQARLRAKQAELDALRRDVLAERYRSARHKARVSDAEIAAYYRDHRDRVRTRVHLYQLMTRSRPEIEKLQRRLRAGASFEDLAREHYPEVPEGARAPWDLGFQPWPQLTERWQRAIEGLEAGQVSEIVGGPSKRFWLIKLIGTRHDPTVTLESVKEALRTVLYRQKIKVLREQEKEQLRRRATIRYAPSVQ